MTEINFEQLTTIPPSMGGQIELPKQLDFLGDKKPYIIYGKEYHTKKKSKKYGKKFIRKKALESIKEKLEFAQKKETDFTKEEMRNMIAREEKKIIKSLGTSGAVTTILALFGITNI